MPRARDIAFIRKLCGLNVPAQALVHSLLPALRVLMPSHSAGVFWADSRGEMESLFAERLLPPDAMAAYYERHYDKVREGFAESFRRRAEAADPVSFHSFTTAEQDSAYFRDVMRPLDAYHVMYGILKRNGISPFAQVSFYRGRADPPFDRSNAEVLRELLRYVASALSRSPALARTDDSTVTVEEHLGVVTAEGAIVSAPESWHRLVRLAALSEMSPRDAVRQNLRGERFRSARFGCRIRRGGAPTRSAC